MRSPDARVAGEPVLADERLSGECVAEGAAFRLAGPALGELGVGGAEFAHDAGRACGCSTLK